MPPELDARSDLDARPGLGAREAGRMQGFVAALLRHEGALVEPIEPDGLEVIAPPSVQAASGLGELSRLGFGTTLPSGAQRVGMEGDWLERFGRVLGNQGRSSRLVRHGLSKQPGDPERVLGHELILDNATYRLLDVSPAWTRYLVMSFRGSAVSDDRRDFMLRLGINLATGAMPDALLATIIPAIDLPAAEVPGADETAPIDPAPPAAELPALWERTRLLALISRALPSRMDLTLGPFMTSLRRRLDRDRGRLHLYHNNLHREAMRRALSLPEGDPKRQREEQRAAAIGREYHAKLDDLARQYATRVTVEWFQTLEVVMPVYRFTVQIRRRKADRTLLLDWNPLARRLEPPLCDATASLERPRLVCDEALHLVAPAGLAPCAGCGRPFCRACHPGRCPKCGTEVAQSTEARCRS